MSFTCLNPFVAVTQFVKEDGKRHLKFFSKNRLDYNLNDLKEKYGVNDVFLLNCGKCESCRRNKAEDWAIRCELEAKEHKYNYFLTLTFDDYHINYASYQDLRDFLNKLEGFNHENKFKYFASMEFGDLTNRLHFHLVLFCDFEIDLYNPVKLGRFMHYHSKKIGELWKHGLHDISTFQTTCARYVAKYTAKNSKLFMSRNLGKTYFLKHYQEIIDDGFKVYSDFGGRFSAYVPSCFLRWFEEVSPGITEQHKEFKKDIALLKEATEKRCLVVTRDEQTLKQRQSRIKEKEVVKRRL